VFFMIPNAKYNYIVTFPLFFLMGGLYCYSARPGATSSYLENWNDSWSDSRECEDFQIRFQCCGLNNAFDRSVRPCPPDFESGCLDMVRGFLDVRFLEILRGGVGAIIGGFVSGCVLCALIYKDASGSVLSQRQSA
jgi:hypothetical protein